MGVQEIHDLVVGTGRVSAAMFVLALLGAGAAERAVALWWAFLGGHTAHFVAVAWFAIVNEGRDLFPGGRSFEDAGGWPTVLGAVALFYALALAGLAERRSGPAAGRWSRMAGLAATVVIGLMFLAVYIPMIASSAFFAMPSMAVMGALGAYLAHAAQQRRKRLP